MELPFSRVRKRNGEKEPFRQGKITHAIYRALTSVNRNDSVLAEHLTHKVIEKLRSRKKAEEPGVEEIQDIVESVLMEDGYVDAARSFILYREKHRILRAAKLELFGVQDDLKLPLHSIQILQERYLLKDEAGKVIETPREMFYRVADAVARAEEVFDEPVEPVRDAFFQLLSSLKFLPNSPALMNAKTPVGQMFACFVLPMEDSISGIFTTLREMAIIHQSGGGTGFDFSPLRPQGDRVATTGGIASGPLSFLRIFNTATEVVKQGGRRRGANMAVLRLNHPDIEQFVRAKEKPGEMESFNFSIGVKDQEMEVMLKGSTLSLENPRDGKQWRSISASQLWDQISRNAWLGGDPGLIFLDRINEANPTPALGEIHSTNPCGEVPLLPHEACVLGSVNLARFIVRDQLDYFALGEAVDTAIRFLDNCIEISRYPLPEIEKAVKGNRKIGLGIMGFADALVKMDTPYESAQALRMAEEIMGFISRRARQASRKLAETRGVFPNYHNSIWKTMNLPLRNATVTSIAPTGTLSMIAGCSSGIEPFYALAYRRFVFEGTQITEVNPLLEEKAKEAGVEDEVLRAVYEDGTLKGGKDIPSDLRALFQTAFEISAKFHIQIQAVFQRYVDNAVSKTVNLPEKTAPGEISRVFELAWRSGCKGITVYRTGSREKQPLIAGLDDGKCETC